MLLFPEKYVFSASVYTDVYKVCCIVDTHNQRWHVLGEMSHVISFASPACAPLFTKMKQVFLILYSPADKLFAELLGDVQ